MEKIDYKKHYKSFYLPKAVPAIIDVPAFSFFTVDGAGAPDGEAYRQAVSLLYGLSYTVKMKGKELPGYVDFTVFPLEGLWWSEGPFDINRREDWLWTSMIRQPDFVDEDIFRWAAATCQKGKPELDVSRARFWRFTEGLCVQMLHIGPYAAEPATVKEMHAFMEQNSLTDETGAARKHHELYLSDPSKVSQDKLKTVLRLPVSKK